MSYVKSKLFFIWHPFIKDHLMMALFLVFTLTEHILSNLISIMFLFSIDFHLFQFIYMFSDLPEPRFLRFPYHLHFMFNRNGFPELPHIFRQRPLLCFFQGWFHHLIEVWAVFLIPQIKCHCLILQSGFLPSIMNMGIFLNLRDVSFMGSPTFVTFGSHHVPEQQPFL